MLPITYTERMMCHKNHLMSRKKCNNFFGTDEEYLFIFLTQESAK